MWRLGHERGQGLVEFALALPVIMLLVFGVVDFGRGIYTYNTLAQSARQAVRTAIVDQRVDAVRASAIAYAPTLGLTNSNVDVCFKKATTTQTDCSTATDDCPQASRTIGCLAIVRSHMTYAPLTPIIGSIVGNISLSSVSIQPIEYVCPYTEHTTCP